MFRSRGANKWIHTPGVTHTHLEVKAGHDGQLLHGQLLGGLLVTVAAAALDLSTAAEMFWSGEPGEEI